MAVRETQVGLGPQVVGLLLIGGYVALVGSAVGPDAYDRWAALVVVPGLVLVSVHLVFRIGRRSQDPALLRLLLLALALKCLGTVARYMMTFVFYDGSADAAMYHNEGVRLAASYRDGDLDAAIGRDLIGTGFIRVLTGALYTVTGPSIYVAYAFYAFLSFWGLYFLYSAFRTGIPSGDSRRYGFLVLLLPSMVFWPSSLGKDAWMTFGIGLFVLGSSRLLAAQHRWLLPVVAGLVATIMVRPPITAALFVGLAAAVLVRRPVSERTAVTPLARASVLLVLVVVGLFAMNRAAEFMEVDSLTPSSVNTATEATGDRTAKGGSEFEAQPVTSVLDMPMATVSVMFRPFLFEANSVPTALAALEGTFLLLLLAVSWPRLRGIFTRLRTEPYLMLCSVYTLLFVFGYSNIANFGILTRQRVQVLPFFLVFLALPLIRNGIHNASRRAQTAEARP